MLIFHGYILMKKCGHYIRKVFSMRLIFYVDLRWTKLNGEKCCNCVPARYIRFSKRYLLKVIFFPRVYPPFGNLFQQFFHSFCQVTCQQIRDVAYNSSTRRKNLSSLRDPFTCLNTIRWSKVVLKKNSFSISKKQSV